MRVYNPSSDRVLTPQLQDLLNNYRYSKNFDPRIYIESKASLLNSYMNKCGLKACVVAVSGGIDSAAVLALVKYASLQENSPIKNITPVLLPVFNNVGATGQEEATQRGKDVCLSQGLEPFVIALEHPHQVLKTNTEKSLHLEGQAWAEGQLVAHTRTPTLYYTATLLSENNLPAIICGTTNRDEGLYLGYFGKASDGLVDVQMISDLHKSEVYAVARYLNIHTSALEVAPKGDMYDGREDEEVFGAPYDFVEYYMHYLTLGSDEQVKIHASLSKIDQEQFDFFKSNLDNMHRYNRHKYFSASPAVHLDLDTMFLSEGWKTNCTFNRPVDRPIDVTKFVNYHISPSLPEIFYKEHDIDIISHNIQDSVVYEFKNLLKEEECSWILENINNDEQWLAVNQYGSKSNFNLSHDIVGSLRKSWYSEELSRILFDRLSPKLAHLMYVKELGELTTPSHCWTFTGVNPLLRFIRYHQDHFLVPHYDYTYVFNQIKKTLQSLVIYLDSSSAQTRFIQDDLSQSWENKDYSDWKEPLQDNQLVLKTFNAQAGHALVFPHRILHDAPKLTENKTKTIIRTDLIYESPYLGFDL